jgi:thiol-disulfide isomerase/thioredoxin
VFHYNRIARLSQLIPALVITFLGAYLSGDVFAAGRLPGPEFKIFDQRPQAQDIKMAGVDGKPFSLSDLRGKVVLLNFWRKDCPWCVKEKEYLRVMSGNFNRDDLRIVCADLWDSPSWVRSNGKGLPTGLSVAARPDEKPLVMENRIHGRVMGYYVLNDSREAVYEVKGFPSTYVIDKSGRVVASHIGMAEWTKPNVRDWLASLLREKSPVQDAVPEQLQDLPDWLHKLLGSPVRQLGMEASRWN